MTAEKWVDALGVTFGIIYFVRFWCEIVGSHKNRAGGTSSPRGSSGMKHMSLDTSDEKLETKGLLFTCFWCSLVPIQQPPGTPCNSEDCMLDFRWCLSEPLR